MSMEIIKPGANFDWLGNRPTFYGLSGTLIAISVLSLGIFGLNFGIDFTGGSEIQLAFVSDPGAAAVREAVEGVGFKNPEVQAYGATSGRTAYLVRIREQVTLIDAAKEADVRGAIEGKAAALGALKEFDAAASGDRIYLKFDRATDTDAVAALFAERGLPEAKVEQRGHPDDHAYVVILQEIQAKLTDDLKGRFGDAFGQIDRAQIVGPKAGKRLRNDGALAVLVALGAILLYIGVRFDFRFAPGAVLALVHDVVITLGVFSMFQRWLEFSLVAIAALLTVAGYSLNDTIVVFDRIRANFEYSRDKDLVRLMNLSINETLGRTIMTSLTTLLVVVALFVFGGGLFRDFAAALFVGITVGTYSSIAIASPIVLRMDALLPRLQAWFLPASAGGGEGDGGGAGKSGGKKGAAARSGV